MIRAFYGRLQALARCSRGVSAIEFGLFAPILVFGFLVMVDIGMAVGTRMELDRNVRSGAQAAMSLNNDAAAIGSIIRASAGAPQDMSVDVEMRCFCGTATVNCTLLCASLDPPSVFFEIRAERPQPGIILGERTIGSETRVQIR